MCWFESSPGHNIKNPLKEAGFSFIHLEYISVRFLTRKLNKGWESLLDQSLPNFVKKGSLTDLHYCRNLQIRNTSLLHTLVLVFVTSIKRGS